MTPWLAAVCMRWEKYGWQFGRITDIVTNATPRVFKKFNYRIIWADGRDPTRSRLSRRCRRATHPPQPRSGCAWTPRRVLRRSPLGLTTASSSPCSPATLARASLASWRRTSSRRKLGSKPILCSLNISPPLSPAGSGAVTAPACGSRVSLFVCLFGAPRRTRAHASVSVSVCLRALK